MTRVHVEHNWMGRTVDVWLFENDGYRVTFDREGKSWYEKVEERVEVEPSLRIPVPLFEAMMREAEGVVPAGTGTTEALRDTRLIRDRLLTMVEKFVEKP